MHNFLFLGYFLYFLIQAQPVRLTVKEQQEDIALLQSNLRKYHPGLYRYTSREDMDNAFDQVASRLADQPIGCFYAEITGLLSQVRCGHTRSSPPTSLQKAFVSHQLFLPFETRYINGKLYIQDVFVSNRLLQKGDEIMAINNQPLQEITDIIFSHLPADGFIQTGKYQQVGTNFSFYYQLYVGTDIKEHQLQIRDVNNELRCISIAGIPWDQLKPVEEQRLPLSLSIHHGYALLDIRTFDSHTINQAGQDYYEFLENSFIELKNKRVKNLVMDLRHNGGGDDNYGATLVSYFAKDSFRYFERIEVTDNYEGYGNVIDKGGRHLMTSHKGLDIWQSNSNRFTGSVYVLIDGFSFSTCADVATVMHHRQLATFIGEETGGGYDGNTSGHSKSLVLPNSEISVNIPMWKYTTVNAGHQYLGRGVIPNFPIEQTRQELIENKDAVMAKALQLIRQP